MQGGTGMFFSAVFKAKARAALRQHWQTALLIALVVNLPTLLVQGIAAFTNSDPLLRAEDLMLQASVSSAAMNALPESLRDMLSEHLCIHYMKHHTRAFPFYSG